MDLEEDEVFDAIDAIKRCPSAVVYEGLCKVAAEHCFLRNNDEDGIYYLSESHAVNLRLRAEQGSNALIRKILEKNASPENSSEGPSKEEPLLCPKVWKDVIGFDNAYSSQKGCGLLERVKALPQEWTIIQLTAAFDPLFAINPEDECYECPPRLYLTRMNCGHIRPLIYTAAVDYTPGEKFSPSSASYEQLIFREKTGTKSFLEELRDIVEDNKRVNQDPKMFKRAKDYWNSRAKHNQRMKMLLNSIETKWLQGWKCIFLGKLVNPKEQKIIQDLVDKVTSAPGVTCDLPPRSIDIISLIISSYPVLNPSELHCLLSDIVPESYESYSKILASLNKALREVCSSSFKHCRPPWQWERYPVILVLDKRIENIPWEVLPLFRGHPFTRVPSIHFVHGLSLNQPDRSCDTLEVDLIGKEADVNASQAYYVVNPDGSLPKTEERMLEYLETRPEKWEGTTGAEFTAEVFFDAIKSNEVVLYCGHGSSKQYLNHSLSNRGSYHVVMLLMGCHSVSTNRIFADLDSWGTVYEYLLARSPCIIGNLWEVTDLESDLVTMKLIDGWLGEPQEEKKKPLANRGTSKPEPTKEKTGDNNETKQTVKYETKGKLLHAMVEARYAAKQFMTSAALVSYGIPVIAKKEDHK